MKNLLLLMLCLVWLSCKQDPTAVSEAATPGTENPTPTLASVDTQPSAEPGTQPIPQSPAVQGAPPFAKPASSPAAQQGITEEAVVVDSLTGNILKGERPVDAISTAISDKPKSVKDPTPLKIVAPQPKTPQESRVVRVLTTNYWVIWALSRIGNPANRTNQGTWFKFNPDGTYTYGFFQKTIGTGAWSFDGKKATLLLDSELLGDDREWSIKIGKDEDVMIWAGTERYFTTHIQSKLMNFLFIPKNRKEIGLDE